MTVQICEMTKHQSSRWLLWTNERQWYTVIWISLLGCCIYWNVIFGSADGDFAKITDFSTISSRCATKNSTVVSANTRSRLDCAQQCSAATEAGCVGFNFLSVFKTCEFFKMEPTQFLSQDGCTYYGVTFFVISKLQFLTNKI